VVKKESKNYVKPHHRWGRGGGPSTPIPAFPFRVPRQKDWFLLLAGGELGVTVFSTLDRISRSCYKY
jgi:hypothetical protein